MKSPEKKHPAEPEQQHHFFASTAFNWAVAPTRREAVEKVARAAGAAIIKGNVKAHGGLYVWTCRVDVPQSARYTIANYAPEYLVPPGEDADERTSRLAVPRSAVMEFRIQNKDGAVAVPEDRTP